MRWAGPENSSNFPATYSKTRTPRPWTRYGPHVQTAEDLQLPLRGTLARNLPRGTTIAVHATDAGLLALLEAGGIAAYTARRLGIVDRPKAGAHTA